MRRAVPVATLALAALAGIASKQPHGRIFPPGPNDKNWVYGTDRRTSVSGFDIRGTIKSRWNTSKGTHCAEWIKEGVLRSIDSDFWWLMRARASSIYGEYFPAQQSLNGNKNIILREGMGIKLLRGIVIHEAAHSTGITPEPLAWKIARDCIGREAEIPRGAPTGGTRGGSGGTGGGGGGGGVGPGSNEEHWCYKITYCGANQPTVEECGPLDEPEPLCESNNFEVTCTSTWHCIKLS